MNQIVTPADVRRLGTILSVWAHPDDETFIAGGLLAAAVQNDQRVICVTATRGEQGVQDESRWPAARLGEIRTHELEAALKMLGLTEHLWLPYRDGECSKVDQAAATEKIAALIKEYQPDSIITFGPDGLTGHPDHQAVGQWVSSAVASTKARASIYHPVYDPVQYEQFLVPLDRKINVFFNIDKPPLVPAKDCAIAFTLTPQILTQKLQALQAMPSQMERTLSAVPPSAQQGIFGFEYFRRQV